MAWNHSEPASSHALTCVPQLKLDQHAVLQPYFLLGKLNADGGTRLRVSVIDVTLQKVGLAHAALSHQDDCSVNGLTFV